MGNPQLRTITTAPLLLAIDARLTARGVPHVLIREDAGIFAGQATAIGVCPTHDRKRVGKAVSSLRLVR